MAHIYVAHKVRPTLTGVFFAVVSALVWGSGDFLGGLATRRGGRPFSVTALAALSGLALIALAAWLRGEPLPAPVDIGWSLAGGMCGMLGIATMYRGLATGRAGLVAPTAAVVGAAVTLTVGILLEGLPQPLQSLGLLIGLAGIWLVSRPADETNATGSGGADRAADSAAFGLAVVAGLFFGGFFVFMGLVERGLVFSPLVLAKASALALALIIVWVRRDPVQSPLAYPLPLLAGLLDAGGNVFYLLARQYARLDVAAILSSMYPASTVLLSAWVLHERIGASQRLGLVLCLAALALIAV